MIDEKTTQLNALRDALKRNGAGMKFSDVESFMADLILNSTLRDDFLDKDHTFPKAVWYCLCNGNADRKLLVSKLYTYFTKHGRDHDKALELVKYALYLSGIDFQPTEISLQSPTPEQLNTENKGGNAQNNMGSNTFQPQVNKPKPQPKRGKKHLWVLGVAAILAVVIFLIFKGSDNKPMDPGTENYVPTESDLVCRKYEGTITLKEYKKSCIMVISHSGGNALKVCVVNKKNQSITTDYDGVIKGNKLELDKGPDLVVRKHKNGKISLKSEEDKNNGMWVFYSTD